MYLARHGKAVDQKGGNQHAGQVGLITIAARLDGGQQIEKITGDGDAINGLQPLSMLDPEALYANGNIAAQAITTGRAFQLGDQQTALG